jgi:hypothetical protein
MLGGVSEDGREVCGEAAWQDNPDGVMELQSVPLPSVLLLTLLGLSPWGYGQTDDFNDANDAGWRR